MYEVFAKKKQLEMRYLNNIKYQNLKMVFYLLPFSNLHGHIGFERKFENMVIQWYNSLSFKLFLTIITRKNTFKSSKEIRIYVYVNNKRIHLKERKRDSYI